VEKENNKDSKVIVMPGKKEEEKRQVKDMQDVCVHLSNTVAIPVASKLSPGQMNLSIQTILSPCIKGQCHHWHKPGLTCKLERS